MGLPADQAGDGLVIALPSVLAAIKRHWKLALFAILALFTTIQTFRLQSTQSALQAETHGRHADRAEYARAQADAAAIALTAKIEKEAEYAAKADEADRNADALSERYRLAVLRFQAAQRAGRKADLREASCASAVFTGEGEGANISISTSDALICGENTAKAQAAVEWIANVAGSD